MRSVPFPRSVIIGAWPVRMPTSPSYAGATIESVVPSKSTASGEITVTVSIGCLLWLALSQPLCILSDVLDSTRHEECLLREIVELAGDEPLERRYRFLELHVLPDDASKLLRDRERLRHEPLHAPRTRNDALVFLGQLVHAKNGDDVLQLLVALKNALHFGRDLIMTLTDVLRIENARR